MKKTIQPKKNRKRGRNILLRSGFSVHLSKSLRDKYKLKNIGIRNGDSVKIMRGKFKNKTGRVEKVNLKKSKVFVEGIQIEKTDGTKAKVGIAPSNLMITSLELGDKLRKLKIERKIISKGENK